MSDRTREALEAGARAAGLADEWTAFEAVMPAADSLGGTFAWQGWQACLKHSPSRAARVSAPTLQPIGYASRAAIRNMQLGLQPAAAIVPAADAENDGDDVPVYLSAPVPGWLPIESAPRDGTRILVYFGRSLGVREVRWIEPSGSDFLIWCVDDRKHGPFPLRGYIESDPTHWMPLPDVPPPQESNP